MENKIIDLLCEYNGFGHWWWNILEPDQEVILEELREILLHEGL